MNSEERRIARAAVDFLKDHGLTIQEGWQLNGKPPQDVAEYLNGMIECCFPSDEAELVAQAADMIEMAMEEASTEAPSQNEKPEAETRDGRYAKEQEPTRACAIEVGRLSGPYSSGCVPGSSGRGT